MSVYLVYQHALDRVTWRYQTRRGRCLGRVSASNVADARVAAAQLAARSPLRIETSLYHVRVVAQHLRRGKFVDAVADAPTQSERSPAGVGML